VRVARIADAVTVARVRSVGVADERAVIAGVAVSIRIEIGL
jgi:hypothetical protein